MNDLCKKSDWAVVKRPSKRILEEGRSSPVTDIRLEMLKTHYGKIWKLENHYNNSRGCWEWANTIAQWKKNKSKLRVAPKTCRGLWDICALKRCGGHREVCEWGCCEWVNEYKEGKLGRKRLRRILQGSTAGVLQKDAVCTRNCENLNESKFSLVVVCVNQWDGKTSTSPQQQNPNFWLIYSTFYGTVWFFTNLRL